MVNGKTGLPVNMAFLIYQKPPVNNTISGAAKIKEYLRCLKIIYKKTGTYMNRTNTTDMLFEPRNIPHESNDKINNEALSLLLFHKKRKQRPLIKKAENAISTSDATAWCRIIGQNKISEADIIEMFLPAPERIDIR